jgi:NtrC-family two-component system response regulator AlgB
LFSPTLTVKASIDKFMSSPPLVRVLVIDDEKNIRTTLSVCLEGIGAQVTSVASADAAVAAMARSAYDLVFIDLRLEKTNGMDLLPQLLSMRPEVGIIVITAYATFETAVESIKLGAVDYLPKPFTPAQIRHAVEKFDSRRAIVQRVAELESKLAQEVPEADLSTSSPAMRLALDLLRRAAVSEAPILLRGESGTGKGILARAVHAQSPRSPRPFVTVNCPTLSEDLLASELFGHAKGAFTGAVRDQAGRVEAAEGGTLFLDEIGEISVHLQAKLLRFLQEKQYERVGENLTRRADVRVIAATNRNLEQDVKEGRFREDLLFRLNVIEVRVPALRERREDIRSIARRFVQFFSKAAGRQVAELSTEAEEALLRYTWPGNVRELRNAIERAIILSPARVLAATALPERIASQTLTLPWLGGDYSLEQVEQEHVLQVLNRVETQEEAARILGIDPSTLWRKRKKYEEES